MIVVLIVALVVAAALASVAYILLSGGGNPPAPTGVKLDHVNITGGATVDQSGYLTLSASAVDTKGTDRTSSATWLWSASPAASVRFATPTSQATVVVQAKQAGSVGITANATWNNSAKQSTRSVTVSALTYGLTPASLFPLVGASFSVNVQVLRGTSLAATYNGTVHFTSDDPGATLPADHTFSAGEAGQTTLSGFNVSKPGAVRITASDTFASITGTTTVNGNRAPVAVINILPNQSNPLMIEANASQSSDPDGNPITYAWEFGDGGTSSLKVDQHTYARAGTYLVNLTVTDSHASSNRTQQSYHAKSPPTAAFTFSLAKAGSDIRISVNGAGSTDADGTIVTYNWTWGDGNYSEVTTPSTTHDYAPFWQDQDVTIILRVTDNDNLKGTTSQTIRITLQNLPPVACFTVGQPIDQINRTVDVDASCSTDPNGAQDLAWYNWSWGDTKWSNVTTPTATHKYTADGNFVINLTVGDRGNLKAYSEHTAPILQPPVAPVAVLVVTRNLMHVDADASQSSDANGDIASYTFRWGDGVAVGPQPGSSSFHNYVSPRAYTITLVVTDSGGRTGTDAKTVSVANSSLDYRYHDFFNVPYGEWWDYRYKLYGDLPIHADCFNETSTTDRVGPQFLCAASPTDGIPDWETYPYTNWYPLPGQIRPGNPTNNPLVYAPYRFDVTGVNVSGYNRSEPVFLPVLNYAAPAGNELDFRWHMRYFDVATANAVTAAGCPGVAPTSNDGFQIRSQIWLTMDLQESKRIFGVPTSDNANQAQTWWNTNTNNACGTQGALEDAVSSWFESLGGPAGSEGKYDIVNSFEYAYTPFYTNITATVDPTTGLTRVYVEHAAWGTEVLLARMFYWGNASYSANYLDSTKAKGWWGMELGWFEDLNFQGALGPPGGGFDFSLSSAMQYHYQQLTFPRANGFDRVDDVPYWTWGPILTDYTNDYSPKHTISELDRYPSPYYGYVHSTPGSARYGQNLTYDYAPIRWDLVAGQTWHFQYPTGNVVFYDPNNTPLGADPRYGAYVAITPARTLAYDSQKPAGFGTWDGAKMTWDVYGVATTGGPVGNAGPDGVPGNSNDRYALDPWGTLNLVPGISAAVLLPSSVPGSLFPSTPSVSDSGTPSTSVTDPSVVATIPMRVATRSRFE